MDIELSTVRFKIHVLYHIATEKKNPFVLQCLRTVIDKTMNDVELIL